MAGSIVSNKHWNVRNYRQRITSQQLKSLLLDELDTIIRGGHILTLRKKYIGVGLYEIWFEMPERKAD